MAREATAATVHYERPENDVDLVDFPSAAVVLGDVP
jgi:hypothetical protein